MEAAGSGQEEEEQMQVDIYIAGNSKKPDSVERWIGYLIRARGSRREVTGTASYEATRHESFLMVMVEALDRFLRPADITMHLEDVWVASCLQRISPDGETEARSLLDRWQESGWRKARGGELENKDLWQRLYNKLRVFEQSGGTFEFVGMSREDEVDCDRMAKIARAIECSMQNPD